jgi:carboxyl-terminal processing protease
MMPQTEDCRLDRRRRRSRRLTTVSLQTVARGSLAPLPLEELQQLAAVFGMVKTDYVEPVDEKKLITDAISGMVARLDPHSQYFDKKSFKEFREGTTGRFVGVGIEISQEDGLVKVVSPIEGSPAFRAGLKPNDLITKIDDTAVRACRCRGGQAHARRANTKVLLTIFRKDENRTFPVTITREEIKTQSVKGKMIEPGYGWIRLSQFQERTVDDFVKQGRRALQGRPEPQGPGARPAQRPGRPARCGRGDLVGLPAGKRDRGLHQRPAGREQVHYKAAPEFYQRRAGQRSAAQPAGRS